MDDLIKIFIGGVIGFFIHGISMKINYKQNLINEKKESYRSIIGQWLRMRNFIYDNHPSIKINPGFDRLFAETIATIGQLILASEDQDMIDSIQNLTEEIYKTEWDKLKPIDRDELVDKFKDQAWVLIPKMRYDIKSSSRLELSDVLHVFTGLFKFK